MNHMKQIQLEKIKKNLEFAHKSPEIVKLRQQCQEIVEGKRKEISKKDIDDAFDAFGIIVKKLSETPEEELELQKFSAKYLFSEIIKVEILKLKTELEYYG